MTKLMAQNKDLQEVCLKKKKKQIKFFQKKDSAPSSGQPAQK